jgi:hypothetical protein
MAYDRIGVPDFMFIVSNKRFWAGNLGFMSMKDLKQPAKVQVKGLKQMVKVQVLMTDDRR